MNPLAAYPLAVTAAVLVPVIMWLTTWPLQPPTDAQAGALAALIMAVVGDLHVWLGGHLSGARETGQMPATPTRLPLSAAGLRDKELVDAIRVAKQRESMEEAIRVAKQPAP